MACGGGAGGKGKKRGKDEKRKIMRQNNNPAQRKKEREKKEASDTLLAESMTINLAILRNVAKIANKKAVETGTADSTKLVSVFTISDAVHTENLKKSGHKAGRRLKSRDVNSLLAMHKRTTAEPHHARAHDSYNLSSNPPLDLPVYKTVNELEATVLMATREGDSKKYYSEKNYHLH